MKTFSKYQELVAEIKEDRKATGGHVGRYAVRIILLDDFEMYRALVHDLNSTVVELTELMEHDNYWFGSHKLCDIVKNEQDDTVIVPVSEVIQFYDESNFVSFLATILLIQNPNNRRIYIPLVGVRNRFQKFWNNFNRKLEGPPVWYLYSDPDMQKKICVYSCNENIDTRLSTIDTNREWLDYWKTDRSRTLVTKSQSLIRRWEEFLPNGCFDKDSLENSKDVLTKVLKLNFDRSYHPSEDKFWNMLLTECEDDPKLCKMFPVQIMEKILGVLDSKQIEDSDLLQLYLDSDDFKRWAIRVIVDQDGIYASYLKVVISKLEDLSEYNIAHGLYFEIFNHSTPGYVEQRKVLIEGLPKDYLTLVGRFIEQWFERLQESGLEKQLCTLYSIEEREYIIKNIAETMDLTELRTLYPELAAYLDWGDISEQGMDIDNQLIDYFRDYNICKLLNLRTTDYEQKFEELNANKDSFYKWYYSVPELKPISGYKMVQLDGVGAEWLPYILYCIRVLGSRYAKEVESFKLTRVMLPSITSTNRIEKAELVRDYDTNIIHKTQGYHYPRSLIEALGLIKELVRVHVMLSPDNKICICADHGASFMCRKNYGSENMHKHLEPSHEGRYYLGDQALPDNQAFFNVGDYFVAFKHHVISTNVRREVHGGATPEEVLVPYILVSKTALGYQREYDISLSGKSLSFDSRVLEVKITPSPDSIPEFWCGDIAITAKQEENVYLLDLSTYQPGKFEIKIKINTFQSFENIEIASGFIEEDLFDE